VHAVYAVEVDASGDACGTSLLHSVQSQRYNTRFSGLSRYTLGEGFLFLFIWPHKTGHGPQMGQRRPHLFRRGPATPDRPLYPSELYVAHPHHPVSSGARGS